MTSVSSAIANSGFATDLSRGLAQATVCTAPPLLMILPYQELSSNPKPSIPKVLITSLCANALALTIFHLGIYTNPNEQARAYMENTDQLLKLGMLFTVIPVAIACIMRLATLSSFAPANLALKKK